MGKQNPDIGELERLFKEDAYTQQVGGMDIRTLTPRPVAGPPRSQLTKELSVTSPSHSCVELGALAYNRASEYSQTQANKFEY